MIEKTNRVRASDHARRLALKAVIDNGLTVKKVTVTGGKIEIHCVGDDQNEPEEHAAIIGGPEDW